MDTDYKNMVAVEFNDCVIFQETESYSSGFRHMEEIRRQGKLCDVILKVCTIYYEAIVNFEK